MQKQCRKCLRIKDAELFAPDKRNKSGLQSWCRSCYLIMYKLRYKAIALRRQKNIVREIKERYGFGIRTVRCLGLQLALYVYEKAGWKCKICSTREDLTVNHIDGNGRHNEERGLPVNNDPNNLEILCRKCHGSVDGKRHGVKWETLKRK